MAIQIIGATGSRIAEVNDAGRLKTQAVTEADMEHSNETGLAWSMPFDAVDPTGANDIFLYVQNTEPSLNLHIRRIYASTTVVGFLEVISVTGTAASGSSATLVNFNTGFSAKTPTGIFETGVDITGLTDAGKFHFQHLTVANQTYEIQIDHDIILAKNGAMALNWVAATGILTGTIDFFLHE